MHCRYVVVLAVVSFCLGEEQSKRTARNPALLHLAHAGQSVGNYVGAAHGGGGGGGGGARIVIVGGQPAHVTTHVASKDSLEELDDELRQHYSAQQSQGYSPVQGSPKTAGFGAPSFRTGPVFNYLGHQGYSPLAFVGHPVASQQGGSSGHPAPHYLAGTAGPSATPATVNYSPSVNYSPVNYSPSAHFSATPTPHTHTLATPVVHSAIPAKLPFHTVPAALAAPGYQGVRYHTPLSHGPIFIPVQTLGHHQPLQAHRFTFARVPTAEYAPSHGPSNEGARSHASYEDFRNSEEERPRYAENYEERRPLNNYQSQQREYESAERHPGGYAQDNAEFDKSYKFGSSEGQQKSTADSPSFFSNSPSEDDDSGSHEASGERHAGNQGVFKYSFADDHKGSEGRHAYQGDGKVATSYQSVTLETHHPVPSYYNQKH